MAQVTERLGQPPAGGLLRDRLAVELRHDVVGGDRALLADDLPHPRQALRHERAVGLDVRVDVGERARVAGEAQARAERLDAIERGQELADRIGRPAVVEVQRHASEQVVAGDQDAALGLVQADV